MLIRIKIQYDKSDFERKYHWDTTSSYLEDVKISFQKW
jgi:hypothetical protein